MAHGNKAAQAARAVTAAVLFMSNTECERGALSVSFVSYIHEIGQSGVVGWCTKASHLTSRRQLQLLTSSSSDPERSEYPN